MIAGVKIRSSVGHKRLLLVSLLLIVVLFASLSVYILTVSVGDSSLEGNVHVKSENELKVAINNAKSGVPVVIALDKDITLTDGALIIPANKDITLTSNKAIGFYKLTGANGLYVPTIGVSRDGILKLEGIIVTHVKGVSGTGVYVYDGGTLILLRGKISGNNIPDSYTGHGHYVGFGGGVYNSGGVFEMFGGEILDNTVGRTGGGVYNVGNFTMHGGKISNNKNTYSGSFTDLAQWSGYGGGINNCGNFTMHGGKISSNNVNQNGGGVSNIGVFELFDGEISSNKAGRDGGGVYNNGIFTMYNGTIFNNNANQNDGGVYNTDYGTFNKLGGKVSGNIELTGDIGVICVIVFVIIVVVLFLYFIKEKKQHKYKQETQDDHIINLTTIMW